MFRSAALVKFLHSLLFVIMNFALAALLYEVIADRITILSWIAAGLFLSESLVLAANRWECPLTRYAEKLGSTHGRVTDIFLPRWLADRAFQILGAVWGCGLLILLIRMVD